MSAHVLLIPGQPLIPVHRPSCRSPRANGWAAAAAMLRAYLAGGKATGTCPGLSIGRMVKGKAVEVPTEKEGQSPCR